MLEAMFSGRHEIPMKNGEVHFDRDPYIFKKMIWMIQHKSTPKFDTKEDEEDFCNELDYWGIDPIEPKLSEKDTYLQTEVFN